MPRIAPRVQAGDDADEVRGRDEEHGVGEAAKEGAPRPAAHDRVALGHAGDLGEGDVDGAQELAAETGGALLVPAGGFGDVRLGRAPDDEAHASAGLVQALLDARAHLLPARAGLRVALEVGEAAVELGGLRLGERELAGLGGDAVPEVLGELDALGDGELEMSRSVLRMASVSPAPRTDATPEWWTLPSRPCCTANAPRMSRRGRPAGSRQTFWRSARCAC